MSDVILEVRDLYTEFHTKQGTVNAVNGAELSLKRGRVLGLVGESGSGKSMTALSILNLVPYPGKVVRGEVLFEGRDLMKLSEAELRKIRGNEISMVLQDPMNGLNPILPIGTQIAEVINAHRKQSKQQTQQDVIQMLRRVGLADPERVTGQYTFQLSGGMAQRAMIAMAMALSPKILLADEPTSALDTTIQAQILNQIRILKDEMGTAVLLITHDLGVIAQVADEVAVMYAGSVVEFGSVQKIFHAPTHPYTYALLQALPRVDESHEGHRELYTIPGTPPNMRDLGPECPFVPRCSKALSVCRVTDRPTLDPLADDPEHRVACYNPVLHSW